MSIEAETLLDNHIVIDKLSMQDIISKAQYSQSYTDFWMRRGVELKALRPPKAFLDEIKTPFQERHCKLREVGFYTFDIETKDGLMGKEIFCWSLSCKQRGGKDSGKLISKVFREDTLDKMFTEIFATKEIIDGKECYVPTNKDKSHFKIIYVQNLSFDIRFVVDYCARHDIPYLPLLSGSNMISFTIDSLKLKFVDTYQFLQSSQENAEIEFEVPSEYTKIDCKEIFEKKYSLWNQKDKDKVLAHNDNDTKALWFIMNKFRQEMFNISGVDCLTVISLASLSMKAFRISMYNQKIYNQYSGKEEPMIIHNPFLFVKKTETGKYGYDLDKKREKFVRESYYGGRNEVFNKNAVKKALYIDRVSMYPSEMKSKYYPLGFPVWINSDIYYRTKEEKEKDVKYLNDIIQKNLPEDKLPLGFIEALIVKTDKVKTNFPVIPSRLNERILFHNANVRGVYTTAELQYAYEKGYKIIPFVGLIYPMKAKIFLPFVNRFYPIKQYSKGGKRKCAKIILNACYGKFGQKFIRKNPSIQYFRTEEECIEYVSENPNCVSHFDVETKLWITTQTITSTTKRPFMNVGIASFITSYSRLALLQYIHKLEDNHVNVWYCDTDSVVIEDKNFERKEENHELGNWEIEQSFEEVKFLAPKCYISIKKGKPYLKMKGVEKRKIKEIVDFNKKLNRYRNLSEIEEEIREPIQLAEKYMSYTEAHRRGSILNTKKLCKHYSFENEKRNFNSEGKSIAWENGDERIEQWLFKEKKKILA